MNCPSKYSISSLRHSFNAFQITSMLLEESATFITSQVSKQKEFFTKIKICCLTIRHSICHFCTRPKRTHHFCSKVGINRKDDNIWQRFTDYSQNTQRQQFNLTTTSAHHTHIHSQNTVFLKVSDVLRIKPLKVITVLAPD